MRTISAAMIAQYTRVLQEREELTDKLAAAEASIEKLAESLKTMARDLEIYKNERRTHVKEIGRWKQKVAAWRDVRALAANDKGLES